MSDAERIELAPGHSISRIINGCWQLSPDHGGGPGEEKHVHRIFSELVDNGFTTFDCADIYAGVEETIGRFRKKIADPNSIQIHTKYAPDSVRLHQLTPEKINAAVDRSLVRLGVETIDLLQFHWWRYDAPGCLDSLETLARIQEAGKIRLLGVTNFDTPHLEELLQSGVPLVSIQCQYSLLDRRPERAMTRLCASRNVALLPYGVLAGGFLTDGYLAADPPKQMNRSLTKYRLIIDEAGGWSALQILLGVLGDIGRRRGVSSTTVAARWVLDRQCTAAIMLGVGKRSRADENREIARFRLDSEDLAAIDYALERLPNPPGDVYSLERDPDSPHSGIIKTNLHDAQ